MKDQYRFTLADGRVASYVPARQSVSVEGTAAAIDLGGAEARLLQLLLDRPGQVHGRDEIMAYVWSGRVVAPGSLNQSVFTLRNALGDGRAHVLIRTVPRRGYAFDAAHVLDEEGAGAPVAITPIAITPAAAANPATPAVRPARKPRRRLWIGAVYVALLALGTWLVIRGDVILSSLTHRVAVETQQHGGVEWKFVDDDDASAKRLRERMAPVVQAVSAQRQGQVWVNRMFRMYDLSCVRSDDSTMEVVASRDAMAHGELVGLVDDCLEVRR